MKRRKNYGTVFVDMEKHEIVEIIESRKKEDVTKTLKQYTEADVVSRDGSPTYSKAITQAGDDIYQINDRFHLLKNLTEYCSDYLKRQLPARIEIPSDKKVQKSESKGTERKTIKQLPFREKVEKAVEMRQNGYKQTQICDQLKIDSRTLIKYLAMTKSEREQYLKSRKKERHDQKVLKKQKKIEKVREMHQNGYTQRGITRITGLDWRTVKRYLDPATSAVNGHYGKKKRSILDPYREAIIEQFEKGQPGTEIAKMIRAKGYNGSDSLIRNFIASLRKQKRDGYLKDKPDRTNTETVKRKHMIKTLYKPCNELKGITKTQFEKVCEKYPKVGKLLNLVRNFKEMLKTNAVEKLDGWKKAARNLDIKAINTFLSGVNRQLESVKNAIRYSYSNGLAEGKVNKIKNLKKTMYGRCSFEMLRAKVMLLK